MSSQDAYRWGHQHMPEARTIAGGLLALSLLGIPSRSRADVPEVGGYAGGTSTSVYTTYDCPPPSSPVDVCVTRSQPHEGTHGVSLGAYLRYAVIPSVMIEANVLYVQKGYSVAPKVRFHYVEVPLLVRVDPFRGRSPARLFAYGGVAPAVRVWCSASGVAFDNDTQSAYSYSGSCDDALFPRTPSRFDLGAAIGGGAGWDFQFGMLEIQGRIVRSLIDIGGRGEGGKTVNDSFSVLVGFGRTLGKP